jgi:molecular chaperone GrpE
MNKKPEHEDKANPEDSSVTHEEIKENETPGLTETSRGELEKQLNAAEEKANQYWDQCLRLQAEIENVRRRAEKDIAAAHKYSQDKLFAELLPVVDSLELGLANFADKKVTTEELVQKLHTGVEMTLTLLLKTLEKFGIKQINPQGEMFNPTWHQALSAQVNKAVKPNTVLQVLQKGYVLQDRLLRPALVIVAKE